MLYFLRIGLLVLGLLVVKTAVAEDSMFLSALEDIPLMTGLSEATEDTVYFDTPAGRIVEVYAQGSVKKETVLMYYKDSLPSLGWKRTVHGTYVREGEYLAVSVSMDKDISVVRFALSPNADMR